MRNHAVLVVLTLAAVSWGAAGDEPVAAATAEELIARSDDLRRQGNLPAVLAVLEAARDAARRAGDARTEAMALHRIGQTQAQAGAYAEALATLESARDLWIALEDPNPLSSTLNGLGIVHRHLGELDRALDCYEEALALLDTSGTGRERGRILTNIAVVQGERGNLRAALATLQQGLASKVQAGDTGSVVVSLDNLAQLYELQGHQELAIEYYRRALAIHEREGDQPARALALGNLGSALRFAGRLPEARATLHEALSIARASGLPGISSLAEMVLAEVALDAGRPAEAEEHAERAAADARWAGTDRVLAESLSLLARARSGRGSPEPALAAAREAVRLAERSEIAWVLIPAQLAAGDAYRALGRLDEAEWAFASAVATVERAREQVAGGEEDSQRFLGQYLDPYHALADLALLSGDAVKGLRWAELARGRVLADVLARGRVRIAGSSTEAERAEEGAIERRIRTAQAALDAPAAGVAGEARKAELRAARRARDHFRARLYAAHPDVGLARGEAEPAGADDASAILARERSAVLLYTVMRDHTWLMVLGGGDARPGVHRIAVGRAALTSRVQRLRDALGRRDLGVSTAARELHRLLLGPAASRIARCDRLYVVPDGVLWELPFAALAPRPGRYLLDDAAISYASSLTALLRLDGSPSRPDATRSLFALGAPSSPGPPLRQAERQVRALERVYGAASSRIYVGREAREERVKAEAGAYPILHFATHGVLDDGSPMYSALLMAQEPEGAAEDGRLEAREVINLPLRAELVVLSACETGRGRVGSGEGMIGLSWAFLVAGARNAVVSQWRVDADSTGALMLELHRRLRLGAPSAPGVAEALRQAARAVRADPRYRHPFYWAAFSVVGTG